MEWQTVPPDLTKGQAKKLIGSLIARRFDQTKAAKGSSAAMAVKCHHCGALLKQTLELTSTTAGLRPPHSAPPAISPSLVSEAKLTSLASPGEPSRQAGIRPPDIAYPQSCESRADSELVFDLDKISGHEFEEVMIAVFQRMGYQTERGKLSNDEGRDIVLRKDGRVVVVECKHQKSPVGRPVIQKLHSAVMTYRHACNGLVVTTSSFSEAASKYVEDINAEPGVTLELWDYERLIRDARDVGVYFVSSLQETKVFFQVPWRTTSEFELLLRHQYFDRVKSKPRNASDVFSVAEMRHEVVPALFLAYAIDKQFQTQTGLVYHAKDSGRLIYPAAGKKIGLQEQTFWRSSNPARLYAQ